MERKYNSGLKYSDSTLKLLLDSVVFENGQFRYKDDIYLATGPAEITGYLSKRFGKYGSAQEFIKKMDKGQMRKILSECSVYERGKKERVPLLNGKDLQATLYLVHVGKLGGVKEPIHANSRKFEFLPE